MRGTLVLLLASLVQCQPPTPPSVQRQPVTPTSALHPPPETKGPRPEPLTPGLPEARNPRSEPAPDPVPELYRALSAKRHHAIVRLKKTATCFEFDFEALAKQGSSAHGVLWLSSPSDSWKLKFELSGATLALKRASTQLPPQGVYVMMCNDQLVLGGTPERPTLNGAPVFDDLESCNQALGRDPALNEEPLVFNPERGLHCISHVAAVLSRQKRRRP